MNRALEFMERETADASSLESPSLRSPSLALQCADFSRWDGGEDEGMQARQPGNDDVSNRDSSDRRDVRTAGCLL